MSARKRIWGWYFFDLATQPYNTLLLTFIFGPYFASVAAEYYLSAGVSGTQADAQAQSLWSLCLTITGLIIGFGAPVLGAIADTSGRRIIWIVGFALLYVLGSYSLWWTLPDGSNMLWMLGAFGIGFIGAEFAYIFTNAQLPSLGKRDEIGKISGDGFAFGYFGGIVSLMIMLLLFVEQENGKTIFLELDPLFGLDAAQKEGTRSVGPFVALWFLVLIIPYFLWVKEDPGEKSPIRIRAGLSSLRRSLLSLKTRKSFSLYLLSSMFYRDALNGLYSFGGIYAVLVLDWGISSLGAFGIVAGLSAAVFCWLGGFVDRKYGPKPVITLAILILILVCITVVNMSREMFFGVPLAAGSALPDLVFMSCGVVIGGIGGVLQSASRTMMVRHTSPERATEGFGLYGLMGRATAFLAPALIGVVTWLTESPRLGVSPLIFLFIIGLILLRWVNKDGDQESNEMA